jgi:hypothetical protein
MGEHDFPFNSVKSKGGLTADLCIRGEQDFAFSCFGLKDGKKKVFFA